MSKTQRLFEVLSDEKIHDVPELIRKVYGLHKPCSARLAARVHDLRKKGYLITSNPKVKGSKIWWYQMVSDDSTKWKKLRGERKGETRKKLN